MKTMAATMSSGTTMERISVVMAETAPTAIIPGFDSRVKTTR
jgi:hypothetical protein